MRLTMRTKRSSTTRLVQGFILWTMLVSGGGFLTMLPMMNYIVPIALLAICLIRFLMQHRVIQRHTLAFMFVTMSYVLFLLVYHLGDRASYVTYVSLAIEIITVILFNQEFRSREEFVSLFVKVVFIMSIYSCICFTLNLLFNFTATTPFLDETRLYKLWMGQNVRGNSRNSGPFWEPGIFQIYVNIALLLTLLYWKNISSKRMRIYTVVFCITVFTTVSTTGYLTLAGILGWKCISMVRSMRTNRMKIIAAFFLPILLLVGAAAVLSTPAVVYKFQASNGSFIRRKDDLSVVLPIIREAGPFGLGASTSGRTELMVRYGIAANGGGNSIAYSSIGSIHGWVSLLLFMGLTLRNCRRSFREHWYILYGTFLISWATEPLMLIPLYYFFFVGFSRCTPQVMTQVYLTENINHHMVHEYTSWKSIMDNYDAGKDERLWHIR